MPDDYVVMTKLEGGGILAIAATPPEGEEMVAAQDVIADLGKITSSIERVGHDMLEAARRAGPGKVTVELGFGLTVEAGYVVALLGKGKGEASINVILEWSRDSEARPAEARP